MKYMDGCAFHYGQYMNENFLYFVQYIPAWDGFRLLNLHYFTQHDGKWHTCASGVESIETIKWSHNLNILEHFSIKAGKRSLTDIRAYFATS